MQQFRMVRQKLLNRMLDECLYRHAAQHGGELELPVFRFGNAPSAATVWRCRPSACGETGELLGYQTATSSGWSSGSATVIRWKPTAPAEVTPIASNMARDAAASLGNRRSLTVTVSRRASERLAQPANPPEVGCKYQLSIPPHRHRRRGHVSPRWAKPASGRWGGDDRLGAEAVHLSERDRRGVRGRSPSFVGGAKPRTAS